MTTASKKPQIIHLYKAYPAYYAECGVHYRRGVRITSSGDERPTCPKCLKAASPERLAEIDARIAAKQAKYAEAKRRGALDDACIGAQRDLLDAKNRLAEFVQAREDVLRDLRDVLVDRGGFGPVSTTLTEILDRIRAYDDATVRLDAAQRARAAAE